MLEPRYPQLSKTPFWLADATLLIAATALVVYGGRPMQLWETIGVVVCVAIGGGLAVLPYLKEYAGTLAMAEADRLAGVSAKLDQLESLADQIAGATGHWQAIQERAHVTAEQAKTVVDRLAQEAETFASAVTRTADTDKKNLKLEVEKLRRSETEWLQSIGRVMDHVFALHLAATRSGQPAVAEQIDRFHAACRDALRRVGFATVVATPDEPFDPRRHQSVDGSSPPENSRVDETVAPGFVFQGHLLRPVIVRLMALGGTGSNALGEKVDSPTAAISGQPPGTEAPQTGRPTVSDADEEDPNAIGAA